MKKIIYFIVLVVCIGVLALFLGNFIKKLNLTFQEHFAPPEELAKTQEKETWLNIFVHGSFGTALGMLSLPKVVKDEVKGSWYHEMIKDMRKDPKFFTEQAILEKGLMQITPTFDLTSMDNKKLAAYPITKAFDEIAQKAYPNQINSYYLFGWTGLVSQKRRRLEAVRFYNEICEEYQKYADWGIRPKIRILTHSHGGNLCLNLAAVNHIVQKIHTSQNLDQELSYNESLLELYNLIKTLPSKELAKTKKKMKRFDYLPDNIEFKVQELVLLGSPIQPETEVFCQYDFFEKIYNIYSTKDYIQQIDFISTKQGFSSQRINPQIANSYDKIIQARIMVSRSIKKERSSQQEKQEKNDVQQPKEPETLLNKIISSAQAYFAEDLKDPTHKELWFAAWEKENELFLAPMPIIVFVPLITKTLNRAKSQINDFDVNIKKAKKDNFLKIQVSKYNQFKVIAEELFPFEIIEKMKENFNKWKPKDEEEKDTNLALIFNDIKAKINRL